MAIQDVRQVELDWYGENGCYPDTRITKDSDGREYVIGDDSWNRKPANKHFQEHCDAAMSFILQPLQ